jgi:hypothetical protein
MTLMAHTYQARIFRLVILELARLIIAGRPASETVGLRALLAECQLDQSVETAALVAAVNYCRGDAEFALEQEV